MCSFATRNDTAFSQAMLSFVRAQAGLIEPQPGRIHFNLSPITRDSSAPQPPRVVEPAGGCPPVAAGRQPLSGAGRSASETRAAAGDPQPLLAKAKPAAATAFDGDACFTMVAPVEIPERVAEVRS